ncbi:ornithine cyclodeaminase family protein [Halocatena pleomorpha]|uniref:Ornithine cyclodeaminase family protein n=1 Tax=Halocatena pleomorpha TaxID=1785090 RepID=A0A3P3RDK1_9EURY|nr:ornithine cyclodeaminase family protein [Halocatena pleomorpha]RRJ30533.1 ornithine cyclodeaminase family protein [Halocatena pleomorpha]
MTETLFLRSEELSGLATPSEYVSAVREGYKQQGSAAPRTKLVAEDNAGMLTGYLAILPETGAMGGYTYAAGFGDKDVHFFLPLFDADSGRPLALLDGASLNPFKTGATGAVGVDALARQDARTLGLIGSGAQARGQLQATMTVRPFETVTVYSPTAESREAFADAMNDRYDATVRPVATSEAAVEGSDVVITATNATEPVFDGDRLEPGTHVTAMGQYDPNVREIDATTVERATYVPDLSARATSDAGAFLQAMDERGLTEADIHGDLGQVLAEEVPGRTTETEITVFDSGGTGIETVAAAHMLYEKAIERDLGEYIDIAPGSAALTGE